METKKLDKEGKVLLYSGITAAFIVFACGIDNILTNGFANAIIGMLECILIGVVFGWISMMIYIIVDKISPKTTQKLSKLMEAEDTPLDDLDEE